MATKLRNITLSAPAETLDAARALAESRGESLNDAFRRWLEQYAAAPMTIAELVARYSTGAPSQPIPPREERNPR